jgi:hypothetical protein
MSKQQNYYTSIYTAAKTLGANDVQAHLAASQASLETGFGRSVKGNNHFNIKAGSKYTGPTIEFRTHEIINGRRVNITDKFRTYSGMEKSVRAYMEFMERRFPKAWNAKTFDEAKKGLRIGGKSAYATDPNYKSKITYIANRFGDAAARQIHPQQRLAESEGVGLGANPGYLDDTRIAAPVPRPGIEELFGTPEMQMAVSDAFPTLPGIFMPQQTTPVPNIKYVAPPSPVRQAAMAQVPQRDTSPVALPVSAQDMVPLSQSSVFGPGNTALQRAPVAPQQTFMPQQRGPVDVPAMPSPVDVGPGRIGQQQMAAPPSPVRQAAAYQAPNLMREGSGVAQADEARSARLDAETERAGWEAAEAASPFFTDAPRVQPEPEIDPGYAPPEPTGNEYLDQIQRAPKTAEAIARATSEQQRGGGPFNELTGALSSIFQAPKLSEWGRQTRADFDASSAAIADRFGDESFTGADVLKGGPGQPGYASVSPGPAQSARSVQSVMSGTVAPGTTAAFHDSTGKPVGTITATPGGWAKYDARFDHHQVMTPFGLTGPYRGKPQFSYGPKGFNYSRGRRGTGRVSKGLGGILGGLFGPAPTTAPATQSFPGQAVQGMQFAVPQTGLGFPAAPSFPGGQNAVMTDFGGWSGMMGPGVDPGGVPDTAGLY